MSDYQSRTSLSYHLYRPEQVAAGEQQAAEQAGIRMRALMAAAGRAAFEQVQQQAAAGARLAVCCGEGNNGGDGYVIARLAQQSGFRVSVFALKANRQLNDIDNNDAEHARQAWRDTGNQEAPLNTFNAAGFDFIVDAVFGTGLSRPLEGELAQWVSAVNAAGVPVLAVDAPSGISADTGAVLGCAIRADWTVTMVALKRGLYTSAGRHYCGEIVLADLAVGHYFEQQQSSDWQLAQKNDCETWLGPRPVHSHKGDFGHVLLVGGQPGMPGAMVLALQAALRCGAGKVSVACHGDNTDIIATSQAEAMVHGIENAEQLKPLLQQATVIVLGPGLGTSRWSRQMFEAVTTSDKPVVIDADGLNLLADSGLSSDRWILTPHPGEAGHLLQQSTKSVEQDRFSAVEAIRSQYGGQILLKGAGSLVATDRGNFVIARGSPAMASGGMGDTLSGVIGALLAQQMSPAQALIAGSYWHAVAGEIAARSGVRGTLASDLLVPLRQLVNGIKVDPLDGNGH
ncbi:NAD(P)H-hydrate dehydratase [Idiomarina seosinensis]|uniref:NAD(P)H-hydrate dehydratase n=1 Tax=Idiomarina seosinensis TaxID=281739 RepID=UPI00384BFBBD